MIKDCLILVPFHNPWKWHTDYANQTAHILSRRNWVVSFLWGDSVSLWEIIIHRKTFFFLKKINPRLYLYQPLHLLPLRRFRTISLLNLWGNLLFVKCILWALAIKTKSKHQILWFFGFFEPLFFLIPRVFGRWFTLYDCVDLTWHPDISINRFLVNEEKRIIKRANLVAVNSHALAHLHHRLRPDVTVVPLGFRLEAFRRYSGKIPFDLPTHKPVIGLVGAIDYRLDYQLLTRLVSANPQWFFALIGPVQSPDRLLLTLPNVINRTVSPELVPEVIAHFDIAIIPYDASLPFNRYSYPTKLMEYFYCGIPVVATPIEELKRFPKYVKIGSTASAWEQHIKELLPRPWPTAYRRQQRRLALENSWENKIETISKAIADTLD